MGAWSRWPAALAEHEREVAAFLMVLQRMPADAWTRAPAPSRWSPAAVALHVCRTYELGRDAAAGGQSMALQVAPPLAWLSRTLLLPLLLATERFPHGARAPAEVVPDLAAAMHLTTVDAAARLRRAATEAAAGLRQAARERSTLRVTHAYFGPLTPLATLRFLSAHTRHHTRGLVDSTLASGR